LFHGGGNGTNMGLCGVFLLDFYDDLQVTDYEAIFIN